MDLHDGDKGCVQEICLGFFGIQDLDRVCATRNGENRTAEEVLRELFSVKSRRSDDEFEIWATLDGLWIKWLVPTHKENIKQYDLLLRSPNQ